MGKLAPLPSDIYKEENSGDSNQGTSCLDFWHRLYLGAGNCGLCPPLGRWAREESGLILLTYNEAHAIPENSAASVATRRLMCSLAILRKMVSFVGLKLWMHFF